ncbi:DUF397 domain-containing protein [Actinomadura verrucosospora]|uniref:Toxin-antitoxin system C toxin component n=1 Tax=Actinomadura verrucosospora TaxID=46165 RepID=A0A7D3VTF2_ACTVE|nr:DUF397 domain-containing protein [Actinomadura verrucosospora]QKG20414.1 toxin-antitoxin system C toxin component [Actinomadura verrucosospora]
MTDHYTGWRKSRHSNPDGHCVEVAMSRRESRFSEPDTHCVETARGASGTVGVRDSKLREDSPILEFSRAEWAAFLARVRNPAS